MTTGSDHVPPHPPRSDVREERKTITVVFADLVGSTALGERLDPEEAKLIVGDAIGRIVRTVESFGGTVKDLAGDGVLALFGAPVAQEDDAERAIRAGLKINEEIGAYAAEVERAWGIGGFGVRVGVDTGPVVVGLIGAGSRVEYAAVGDAVNTAARLQSHAEPGTVLASATTRRLVEALFEWGERRALTLKGKVGPVEAAVPLRAVARGRPAPSQTTQTRFVGRDRELADAEEAFAEVAQGAGRMLFVTGEAGIGKSRLLAELKERVATADVPHGRALWLECRCVSYGDSLPYWPYRDLLREWLGAALDEPELRVRVKLRRAVAQLFGDREREIYPYLGALLGITPEPEAAAHLAQLSPEALQYRTFEVVQALVARLADDGPVVLVLGDLHWADPTSLQLTEALLPVTESAAVLLILALRVEPDHPSWNIAETARRTLPHRTKELRLEALSGDANLALLEALVGRDVLPEDLRKRLLTDAEGNPFYLEELVRGLIDAGALVRDGDVWRFDHEVPIEVPPTVEKVILARIDRLTPACHDVLTAASVLGRRFGLPLLEGVADGNGSVRDALSELQRLDLLRETRRWPQPEFRFKHALIQEAAYRTLVAEQRTSLHRRAAEWLEQRHEDAREDVLGLLAHHWTAANDEEKAVAYLMRAGDQARQTYALDEAVRQYRALLPLLERRGERRAVALVLFKLALALHTSLRFDEANETYQRAFDFWDRPEPWGGKPSAILRVADSFLANDPDPKSAIAWPNIRLCMQLFDRLVEAWPERTLVPSLAERWEIAADGLRYVFHLREGVAWSDGVPLTAHDVEFGIKRVLDPQSPGSSVAIYFVLENGRDYYLGRETDHRRIGVRALDDRTVEFRLAAPAPYFMSVMNRPDAGPQPRHAIESHGPRWVEPQNQVVSGPFRQERRTPDTLVLVRQEAYRGTRPGNVGRIEFVRQPVAAAIEPYRRDELDVIAGHYTPRLVDVLPVVPEEATLGPAAWSAYLSFDHGHPVAGTLELRQALAHAVDRAALAEVCPANLIVATGGVVPPALQGHTPDIALRFDPDRARAYLAAAAEHDRLAIVAFESWGPIVATLVRTWRDVLGLTVDVHLWTVEEALAVPSPWDVAPITISGWLPGYPDPEYYLRLLLHSDSKTNEGGFAYAPLDELIERATQERNDRARLELFHEADRVAVAERVALIPLAYGRSMAFTKPWVRGWWEFGKSASSFADLVIDDSSPRDRPHPASELGG